MHYVKEEIGDSKGAFEWKIRQNNTCKSFHSHWLPTPLLSLSRCHLSPAGPPRVCVFPRHLCLRPPPGGPLLGQTLPAAAWGPGADCQKSGHLELWGGQTCLQSHTEPTHEKQTYSSFTYPSWRHLVVQGKWLCMNIQGEVFWLHWNGALILPCSRKADKALWLVDKHLLIETCCVKQPDKLFVFVHQVASFVKGLPGCKEHATTFKTEVSTSLPTRTSTYWHTCLRIQVMITLFNAE